MFHSNRPRLLGADRFDSFGAEYMDVSTTGAGTTRMALKALSTVREGVDSREKRACNFFRCSASKVHSEDLGNLVADVIRVGLDPRRG